MSEFASKLTRLPEANDAAWNEINKIIVGRSVGVTGRIESVSYYIPGEDKWDFADIGENKRSAIQEVLRKHPLGADHFPEWLKNGSVKLPNFNHPSDPTFLSVYLEIHWICGANQVSHTLHYSECDHNWYFEIQSAADAEDFSGKSYSLSTACECVLEHLFKMSKKYLLGLRGMSDNGNVSKDETTEKANFVMGYGGGRVNLTAGENQRTQHYVVGIKDISFASRTGGWQTAKPTEFSLVHVEGDIDQLQYRLKLDGKDVGMIQFDFGHRTIEWEVDKKYVGTTVSYTAILSKNKP